MIINKPHEETCKLPEHLDSQPEVKRAWVTIRAWNDGKRKEFMAFAMSSSMNSDGQQLKFDAYKGMEFKAQHRIVKWGNIFDDENNPFALNPRNRLTFISQDGFEDWLDQESKRIDEVAKEKNKAQEKNLKN